MPSYDSVEPHPIEVESEGVDRLLPFRDLDDFFFWRKKGAAHEKLKRSSRKIEETGSKRRMLPSTMGSCFRIVPGNGRNMHGCLTFDPKEEENWMHVMESDGPVQIFAAKAVATQSDEQKDFDLLREFLGFKARDTKGFKGDPGQIT